MGRRAVAVGMIFWEEGIKNNHPNRIKRRRRKERGSMVDGVCVRLWCHKEEEKDRQEPTGKRDHSKGEGECSTGAKTKRRSGEPKRPGRGETELSCLDWADRGFVWFVMA
jgi:hypothetical protein